MRSGASGWILTIRKIRAIVTPVERRIDEILGGARDAGRTVLTPYLCAGFPDNDAIEPMLGACEHAGCPMAIVGVPYVGAIFEGADVCGAMGRVLSRGFRLDGFLEQVRRARAIGAISGRFGLVAAVAAAVANRDRGAGLAEFMRRTKAAGFDAVLMVDVPLEEVGAYRVAADGAGLQFPMVVSQAAPQPRLVEIAKTATGFVLLATRGGSPDLGGTASRLRDAARLSVLMGVEAAKVSHVRSATEHCDGVIVAGALVRRVSGSSGKHAGELAGEYLRELAAGLGPAHSLGDAA